MPFDPTLPLANSPLNSAVIRNQFNGLKDLIDALPAPPAETDPVFTASEAALFAPGDKAKLDVLPAGAPTIAEVLQAGNVVGGALDLLDVHLITCAQLGSGTPGIPVSMVTGVDAYGQQIKSLADPTSVDDADTLGARNAALAAAVAYTPVDPSRWVNPPPATLAQAIDLLAEILSNHGANPVG